MGWCSGTKLFDDLCSVFFDPKLTDFGVILKRIIVAFEDMDWDCHQDSDYWDTPVVQKAMRELHPDWFEEDEEDTSD